MLRFTDSFDHYSLTHITRKWTQSVGSSANQSITASSGRRSTASFRVTNPGNTGLSKTLDAQATWVVGFAFRAGSLPATSKHLVKFFDTATLHCDVRLNTDGTLTATRNGTSLGSSSNSLSAGTYYYLEVKVTISDGAGAIEVRVNGSSTGWINLTGIDTRNAGNASANVIQIFGGGNSENVNFDADDLYICDATGSTNNNFLGDVRVDAFFPDGNGNSSQFTGNDGNSTDNYQLVDDTAPDDDTTYVESDTPTEIDTYTFPGMLHTPSSIHGLQINMMSKKDDSGSRNIASVIRSGGTNTSGTSQALATSYVNYTQISETDPNTSAAWTSSGFGNAEFGITVAA